MVASRLAPASDLPRVLVVDDDDEYRLVLRGILERHGYEVHEAGNGLDGLDACRRIQPSIVLLDVNMPVMNGNGFLDAKQRDARITSIPVVVISTSDIGTGASVVRQFRKPVSAEVLTTIVRLVVGASRHGNR